MAHMGTKARRVVSGHRSPRAVLPRVVTGAAVLHIDEWLHAIHGTIAVVLPHRRLIDTRPFARATDLS
jgi:hypothetical protein